MISIIIMLIKTILMQERLFSPLSISYTGTSCKTCAPWQRVDWARGRDPSSATGLSALPHVCVLVQDWHRTGSRCSMATVSLDMSAARGSGTWKQWTPIPWLKFEHNNRLSQILHKTKCFGKLISITFLQAPQLVEARMQAELSPSLQVRFICIIIIVIVVQSHS